MLSQFRKSCAKFVLALFAGLVGFGSEAMPQRPRFQDPFQLQSPASATANQGGQSAAGQPAVIQLPGVLNSPPSITVTPPPRSIAAPGFDPFRSGSQPLAGAPGGNSTNNVYSQAGGPQGAPYSAASYGMAQQQEFQILPPATNLQPVAPPGNVGLVSPGYQAPNVVQPQYFNDAANFAQPPIYQQPQYGVGGANGSQYGSNPSSWPSTGSAWPSQVWARMRDDYLPRLLERPRFRYTFIPGNDYNQVQVNDLDIATTLTFPKLFNASQPFRLTPGFALGLWSGPDTIQTGGFELPSKVYSAFLALDHVTDTSLRWGWETNFTIGVYSEFGVYNTDSLRLTGLGLLWFRVNQTNTFKIGAEYLDRVKIKLLPAFGVFVMPTPDVKMDIYFPRPRIAQRMPNVYCYETWSYVGAEYGGGSWTINRPIAGFVDQVDMNDIRAFVGVEWMGPRRRTGFFECGYVFNRELVYASGIPMPDLTLKDAFMLRTGIAF